ncbi:MAG: bifunctional precorrin-2 dehydrogenase/sirohydrochlorin ferrochelatase [Candidatus Hydrogenedentes bacterium]|nr:bifunctional precorrin-2 dehydrogenase/sirohydrochlorin ferrochelatase [Candidatus Hydrogenedentota bacterium]
MPLYPLALKLSGRRCVVVGGGAVAERKVASLLECGADVVVVAPDATDQIRAWSGSGRIKFLERPFEPSDVAGALIVIAATDDSRVNSAVADAARASGALVNVVDVPELCDFYVPASVTRGDLQITISTGGSSPALAKRIRIDLERQFGPEYESYLELLARLRSELKARVTDRTRRNEAEEQFLASPALQLIAEGRLKDAEQILADCLRMAEA